MPLQLRSDEYPDVTPSDSAPPVDWYATAKFLLHRVRRQWHIVLGFALLGAATAGGIAFLLPSYFRSGAAFQAESILPPSLSGALSGLSQFGGLQLGGQSSTQLFADLLSTDAVLRRVAHAQYPWRGALEPLTKIYGYDGEPPEVADYNTVRRLRRALNVDVTIRTGVVRFTLEAPTPDLAYALAESTLSALNQENITLRQQRAGAEKAFTADRAEHARLDLGTAEAALASFYERNRAIANSPALLLEEARLKRAVDVAQQVYLQLRLQEEQAAVQEVRNTPSISIIDPPLVPVKRSRPNRRLAVLGGLLAGLALAVFRLQLQR